MKEIFTGCWTIPIKLWLPDKGGDARDDIDAGTWEQACNLAQHPVVWKHVALMPDSHSGYGMPIGGVIACDNAVISNAVGKDIGCGMCSIRTNLVAEMINTDTLEEIRTKIKKHIPHGEGNVNRDEQDWDRFDEEFIHNHNWVDSDGVTHMSNCYDDSYPAWFGPDPEKKLKWFKRSLCSLGGGK